MLTYPSNEQVNIKDATKLVDILKGVSSPSTGSPTTTSGASNAATAAAKRNAGITTPYSDAAGNAVTGRLGGKNIIGGNATAVASPYAGLGGMPTLAEARNDARRQAQLVVNAIKAQYAPIIDETQAAADSMKGRVRASNISSGLAGSDFASGAAQRADDDAAKAMSLVYKERGAKIAEVMGEVGGRSSEEFRKQRESFLAAAQSNYDLQEQFRTDMRNRYETNVADLASSGLSLDEFRSQYPDEYRQLVSEAGDLGKSEFAMQWQYMNAIPKEQILDKEVVGNNMVYFFQDPQDPTKIRTQKIALPAGEELGKSEDIIDDGYGNPLIVTYSGEKGKSKIVGVRGVAGAVQKTPYGDAYARTAGEADAKREFETGGWSFEPDEREKSLVFRHLSQNPEADEQDMEKVKTDEGFFYFILDQAVQDSAGTDTSLEREPFASPTFF